MGLHLEVNRGVAYALDGRLDRLLQRSLMKPKSSEGLPAGEWHPRGLAQLSVGGTLLITVALFLLPLQHAPGFVRGPEGGHQGGAHPGGKC